MRANLSFISFTKKNRLSCRQKLNFIYSIVYILLHVELVNKVVLCIR